MKHVSSSLDIEPLEALAEKTGLPFSPDISTYPYIQDKVRILPYNFVKKNGLIPLREEEGKILVAISDPYDLDAIEEVRHLTNKTIQEILARKSAIDAAIEACYQQREDEATEYIQGLQESDGIQSIDEEGEYDLLDQETDSSVVKVLNMILMEALGEDASDIHFEPVAGGLQVRYRIDGVLQLKHTLGKEVQIPLTTRIKVLSQLDIAEFRLPQDGRLKLKMGGREIDFRISTVPVVFGERVVLRILDRINSFSGLEQIGMPQNTLSEIRKILGCTQGILLVTGPTGSGKSTTLYAALTEIRSSEMNIMTIEDPVEIKLEGMAQIGVNPKIDLTFSAGLRHILRQDPDVIMIGEIRDRETAEIAIQASLTGHLVLSTLHTNDAPSAIARLVDMGIEPYLISSSLIGVLAQRLVRRICPHCKTTYRPTLQEIQDLGIDEEAIAMDSVEFARGAGCDYCFGRGYRGRCGLYEFMPMTNKVKNQMLKSANANELRKLAIQEGMTTLSKEGANLALEGMTTHEEVLRVTKSISGSE